MIRALLAIAGSLALVALLSGSSAAQPEGVRQSHIDANVPDVGVFREILSRDLLKYVTDPGEAGISVEVELLREIPTQSGTAYPKFYCWLRKLNARKEIVEEAAVRVAAVEKKRFDVIQYFPRKRVVAEKELMYKVFPKEVADKIMARALQR